MTEDRPTASVTHSSLDYLTKPDQHYIMSCMIFTLQRSNTSLGHETPGRLRRSLRLWTGSSPSCCGFLSHRAPVAHSAGGHIQSWFSALPRDCEGAHQGSTRSQTDWPPLDLLSPFLQGFAEVSVAPVVDLLCCGERRTNSLTNSEEGAELQRPYGQWSFCPVSLRLRGRFRAAETGVSAIDVLHKTLRELKRYLRDIVYVTWSEGERPPIGWSEATCAFTSGVSKMRLTCVRSVMCQVYLVKEPRGRPSFLTNTGLSKKSPRNLFSAPESLGLIVKVKLSRLPVVKLGSLFFLEPSESRCCRTLKNSWGMW